MMHIYANTHPEHKPPNIPALFVCSNEYVFECKQSTDIAVM